MKVASVAVVQILHFSNKCSLVPFLSHQTTIHPQQPGQKPQLQGRISQRRPKQTTQIHGEPVPTIAWVLLYDSIRSEENQC